MKDIDRILKGDIKVVKKLMKNKKRR